MIWVSGEALIDLLPTGPVPGGGAANTAVALSRLECDVHFVGGLSTDNFGELLKKHLNSSGVDLSHSITSDLPTAVAQVEINSDGSASYEFLLDNTATFAFDERSLPQGNPSVLHIGSLATVIEPAATHLFNWAKQLDATIVFDPNVRPAVITNSLIYRQYVERWAQIADVIKLSDEDLHFLYPEVDELDAVRGLMSQRCQLIVLTRGADGLTGYSRGQLVTTPGVVVDVVDTVGAGDTVGAVIVEALAQGLDLTGQALEATLARAARAAALTCSRAGCNPPTAAELG